MFIQTEETPNPATLKFLPGEEVVRVGTADFPTVESAERSPLAKRLFSVPGVAAVFLGSDFVTVTKAPDTEWHILKPSALGAIMEHFTSGQPTILDDIPGTAAEDDDDEVVSQIRELIDTRVRPAVAMDGGDIIFHGFEEGVVYLHMQGACSGCPSSAITLKSGIENMLRHYIPEVREVQQV